MNNAQLLTRFAALEYLDRNITAPRFQEVLTAATAAGGGVIHLGPYTYNFGSTTINLDGNVVLEGVGEGLTILKWTSGTGIQINSGAGTETLKAGLRFLTIDGTSATTGADYGIVLGNGAASSNKTGSGFFECVTVKRCKTAGVQLQYTALATWLRCSFESNKDGVWANGTYDNGVTTQSFIGCRFANNTKRGAFFESANSIVFSSNCQIEDNGEEGALFRHNGSATSVFRNVTLQECYVEDNGTAGAFSDVRFDNVGSQSFQNVRVRGCIFSGTNADGNLWFGKGTAFEEDNEFLNVSTSCVIVSNSTVAFMHSRGLRDPATLYTLGANAGTTHERRGGNGTMTAYYNAAGTMTRYGYRATTATTVTHLATDDTIAASANSGAVSVNLLAAATVKRGYRLTVIKTDSGGNAVTLDGNSSETINGAATLALAAQYDRATIVSDGTNWLRVD